MSVQRPATAFSPRFAQIGNAKPWRHRSLAFAWSACALELCWLPAAALARILTPFRMGMGGRLGSGRQWIPWIQIKDVAGIILHASRNKEINGPMNAVAPRPVTNVDFARALAHALYRPVLLPVPRTALRLAFGELSEILIASPRVFPRVAEHTGYTFEYSDLDGALDDVMTSMARSSAA